MDGERLRGRQGVAAGGARVRHFNPIPAPARTVRPITALRDDALGAERARVAEDGFAVAVEVLGKADPRAPIAQQPGERRTANFP